MSKKNFFQRNMQFHISFWGHLQVISHYKFKISIDDLHVELKNSEECDLAFESKVMWFGFNIELCRKISANSSVFTLESNQICLKSSISPTVPQVSRFFHKTEFPLTAKSKKSFSLSCSLCLSQYPHKYFDDIFRAYQIRGY